MPLVCTQKLEENIFSTHRLNLWNGKFIIGSLYDFISSPKFSVLVSQASCLIIMQLTSVLPGMKYLMERIVDTDILSQCSWHEQWQLEWSCVSNDLDSLCSLMSMFLRNLKESSSSLLHGQLYGLTLSPIPDSC